jgi:hypothetical protein
MRFTTKPKNHYKQIRSSVKEGQVLLIPMDNRLLEDVKPYAAGGKKLPTWFKLAPKEGIRRCAGVLEYLETGFIIPAWTDFAFEPRPELSGWEVNIGQMPFAKTPFESQPFPLSSTGECPMTRARDIEGSPYPKLVNPYSIVTAKGWSSIIHGIPYEPNPHYDVVPAIVHTDYYHQMNVVLNLKGSEPFVIRYGEPLVHIYPFKRSGNTEVIKFGTEEDYKYVYGRGVSDGPTRLEGEGVGLGYRKHRKSNDAD